MDDWGYLAVGLAIFLFVGIPLVRWLATPGVMAIQSLFQDCPLDQAMQIRAAMDNLGLNYDEVHTLVSHALGTFTPFFPDDMQIKANRQEIVRASFEVLIGNSIRKDFSEDDFLEAVARRIMVNRGPGATFQSLPRERKVYGPGHRASENPDIGGIKF